MLPRPHRVCSHIERATAAGGVAGDLALAASRLRRWLVVGAGAALLVGCGGGLFLGIELGGSNDQPPSVALTASLDQAPAGASVRLVAAASDDFGVDAVSFYRQETVAPDTLLGTDGVAPFQVDTVVPAGPVGTVWRYYARAFDGAGQRGDSALVEITVR